MDATDKFKLGQRVVMSEDGLRNLKWLLSSSPIPTVVGTVAGFSKSEFCVLILRKGHKSKESYHMDYWEPL